MYPNNTVDFDNGFRHYRKSFYVEYQYVNIPGQHKCGYYYFPRWNNHTGHILFGNDNDRPIFVKEVYIQLDHGMTSTLNNHENCWRLYHLDANDDPNEFFKDIEFKGPDFVDPTPQDELRRAYNLAKWYIDIEQPGYYNDAKKIFEKRCEIPVAFGNVINQTVTLNRMFNPGDKLVLIFYTIGMIGYLYDDNGTIEVHYDTLACRHWCYSDTKISVY